MDAHVQKSEDRSRYELVVDGEVVGIADYHERGDHVVMPHTVIDPSRRGEGLGAVLVEGALDDVRALGKQVIPACWYVREFIDGHRDYADLVA